MPSDPPTPEQWNLQGGWLAAYQAAARRASVPPIIQPPPRQPEPPKNEPVEEPMQGGWKFEGKEKPGIIRICPRCQGNKRDPEDLEKSNWCESCQEGKLLGHPPKKSEPARKDKEVFNNTAFFGS